MDVPSSASVLRNNIDAAAVCQTSIDHRIGFIDALADARGNALRNIEDVLFINKGNGRQFKFAEALDKHLISAVDEKYP